jgi:hypothetical protein
MRLSTTAGQQALIDYLFRADFQYSLELVELGCGIGEFNEADFNYLLGAGAIEITEDGAVQLTAMTVDALRDSTASAVR